MILRSLITIWIRISTQKLLEDGNENQKGFPHTRQLYSQSLAFDQKHYSTSHCDLQENIWNLLPRSTKFDKNKLIP